MHKEVQKIVFGINRQQFYDLLISVQVLDFLFIYFYLCKFYTLNPVNT